MCAKPSDKVKDRELAEWLRSGGDEERELIVQAEAPPRKATIERRRNGRVIPTRIKKAEGALREEAVSRLADELNRFVDQRPIILKSAGAVVVRATRNQVLRFANHPLVKTIYPNRTLRKGHT